MHAITMVRLATGVMIGLVAIAAGAAEPSVPPEWSPEFVQQALADARAHGDPRRGADVFWAASSSCTSCHRVGDQGGRVGPELTTVATCPVSRSCPLTGPTTRST
jgi:cytochrome c2